MSAALIIAALAQAATTTGPSVVRTTVDPTGPKLGTLTYVDAEAGLGLATNPYLGAGSGGVQGFGRVSLRLVHTRVSDRTTTVLSAYGQDVTYAGRYGSQQSFDLNARHDVRVNERLAVFVDGDAAYDRGGQLGTRILAAPDVPLAPGVILPPQLLPPGTDFLAASGRTYRFDVNVGGQLALSERASANFSAGVAHNVFKASRFDTRYTSFPVSVGYEQRLNPRATVGAAVSGTFTSYAGTSTGLGRDYHVVTPELTGRLLLAENVSVSGGVGLSVASFQTGSSSRTSTGLSAHAAVCGSGEKSEYCGRASVQQGTPTSVGPSKTIAIGVDYTRRLGADDDLRFSLDAERYSNPIVLVAGESFTHGSYLRAAASYSRNLGDRWFGGLDLAARKRASNGPGPATSVSTSLFVRYRFGDLK